MEIGLSLFEKSERASATNERTNQQTGRQTRMIRVITVLALAGIDYVGATYSVSKRNPEVFWHFFRTVFSPNFAGLLGYTFLSTL